MSTFFNRLLIGLLFFCGSARAQNIPNSITSPASATARQVPDYLFDGDTAKAYVRTYIPVKPIQDSSLINMSSVVEDVLTSVTYFDAFGRPVQQIVKQGSPLKKDNVTPLLYDEFNRQAVTYLPYVDNTDDGKLKLNAFTKDSTFYKTNFPNEAINYSNTLYDASPLNIQVKTLSPGNSWGGADVGITYGHRANAIADSVVLWTIGLNSEDEIPVKSAFYVPGTLTVQEITDEHGIKTVQYTNASGQTLLTKKQLASIPGTAHIGWLCTYYVYDEAGMLRYVLPPRTVEALNSSVNNWNLATTPAINTDLCFAYFYDSRGRAVMKRIPGKGKFYIAYDLYDRVVLTQDSNLRATSQWAFLLYDAQSRASQAGFITLASNKDTVIAQASRSLAYPTLSGTYTLTMETYYDDYGWTYSFGFGDPAVTPAEGLTTTDINGTNFYTSYNTSPIYAQPITLSPRIRGAVTGIKKLILNTSDYLYVVNVYDDKGRVIQTRQNNYTNGIDETTFQYNYSGKVLRTYLKHKKRGTNAQTHSVLTKYSYDHVGRLETLIKNFDGLGDKTIAAHTYNELGQLNKKTIGNGIETQNFSYNIRGWLLGINKDHVNNSTPTNFFGETIAYDYGFIGTQLNGNKAGIKWRMAGDSNVRAYGYGYDNANRLVNADFTQQNNGSSSWTRDKVDFSVNNLSFDANGNILTMSQRGLQVGSSSLIDSLSYQYFANTNKLQKVADHATAGGELGDFKDSSSTGDDYTYDANGNINRDNNRHMHTTANGAGAVFNMLDKADSIVIAGKATTYYYYDISGAMLAKKVNTYTASGLTVKNYHYLGGFVYLNDTLQYTVIEGGRIRYAKKKNSSSDISYFAYEYDYFISDHMGNVRSVVTEGRDTTSYIATMEPAMAAMETELFANEYTPVNTILTKPVAFDSDTANHNVARLNGSAIINKKMGPALVLKVMAGDKVQVNTWAFYNTPTQTPIPGTDLLSNILAILPTGVVGNSAGKLNPGNAPAVSTVISPAVTDFLDGRTPDYDPLKPKAFLNWVLFDNQFNFIAGNSGVVQVEPGASKQALVAPLQTIAKNGYLFVYVSNESPQDVYFDDLTITHTTGPLMQEQSYYPYGLEMQGLSDKAMMKTAVSYKYNAGSELEEEDGIGYYNTFFRKYDAQIGRFTGVDILSEQNFGMTPFQFGNNNPALLNDPSGALADLFEILKGLWDSPHGGQWSSSDVNTLYLYGDDQTSILFGSLTAVGSTYDFGAAENIDQRGAWQVSNTWNAKTIGKYREYVSTVYNAYYKYAGGNYTCEDLSLNILTWFAASNSLPLTIKNNTYPNGVKPENFDSVDEFYVAAASTTAARDLHLKQNAIETKTPERGDLILQINDKGNAHHVQVITNITSSALYIIQGNFKDTWYQRMINLSNNPRDPFYRGTDIQQGYYSLNTGNFVNVTLDRVREGLLNNKETRFFQWNFLSFNKR